MAHSSVLLPSSLGVVDDLGIHVLWDLAGKAHSHADNLLGVQAGQVAQDGIWTSPLKSAL